MFATQSRCTARFYYHMMILWLLTAGCARSGPSKDSDTGSNATSSEEEALFLTRETACEFLGRLARSHDTVVELLSYSLDLEYVDYWTSRCHDEMQDYPGLKPPYC